MGGTTDTIAQQQQAQRPADQGPCVATRDEVISVLRVEAAAIRKFAATALYLFGSAARDEIGAKSDVDVFVDFDPEGPFSFVELIGLQELLREKLQRDVDLTTRGGLHPRLRARIERSSIKVL